VAAGDAAAGGRGHALGRAPTTADAGVLSAPTEAAAVGVRSSRAAASPCGFHDISKKDDIMGKQFPI